MSDSESLLLLLCVTWTNRSRLHGFEKMKTNFADRQQEGMGRQDDSFSSPPFHFCLMFTSYRVKGGQDDSFFSPPFHFSLMLTTKILVTGLREGKMIPYPVFLFISV